MRIDSQHYFKYLSVNTFAESIIKISGFPCKNMLEVLDSFTTISHLYLPISRISCSEFLQMKKTALVKAAPYFHDPSVYLISIFTTCSL